MKNDFLIILIITAICFNGCNHSTNPEDKKETITALEKLNEVTSLVESFPNKLELLSINSSNVNDDGESLNWNYKYSAGDPGVDYRFHTDINGASFDSTSTLVLLGNKVIANIYFDSNKALKLAEANGGSDFRKTHKDFVIEATLTEPLVPNSQPMWFIRYTSETGDQRILHLGINCVTKEVGFYY
ncbi:MAG: hypothetical protein JEY94_07435 [Melioribacteraceae bacterium]|nr:hypothetical protein [Melioribacteraceae bacterium]